MKKDFVPEPTTMPVDLEKWKKRLNLSNFINTYYQYRDLQLCQDVKSILIIGPGQGLDTQVFKWKGYKVTTFDIDSTFTPDYQGSVHNMAMFSDKQFDAVIASHVLEHLAEPYLDVSLKEIARIGKFALIYLPVAGRHFQIRLLPGVKGIDVSFIFDLFSYFHKPDGNTPRYMSNQHYWEIGMRGFRVSEMTKRFSKFFEILSSYRNKDWNPSHNFILKSLN